MPGDVRLRWSRYHLVGDWRQKGWLIEAGLPRRPRERPQWRVVALLPVESDPDLFMRCLRSGGVPPGMHVRDFELARRTFGKALEEARRRLDVR